MNDPELASDSPDSLTSFFLRITSEQNYNQTPYNEVGRTVALFENTQASKELKVIRPGWDAELFGCTLSQYTGAGFFVQATAANNGGRFSAEWFNNPQLEPITAVLPSQVLAAAVDQNFVGTTGWFRSKRVTTPADVLLEQVANVVCEAVAPLLRARVIDAERADLAKHQKD
jgi:hypothetical protein